MFRTIRFRLTLWYVLTLAVILTASSIFWISNLSRTLLQHVDERLLLVADNISTYHFTQHAPQPAQPSCEGLQSFIGRHSWHSYVQVLNAEGTITCTTPNLDRFRLPLNKEALLHAARGEPYFESIDSLDTHAVRVLTFPILEQGKIFELIQVGEDLGAADDTVRHFRTTLLTFSPLLFLGLAMGGWFLAGRTLAPVLRLTQMMQKITVENLGERLPVSRTGDELAHLTENFNVMLGRLSDSVERIRQFSGDASHELRTPLAILKGETEVALRWAKDPEELRSTLASNLEEIDRMGRIIDDLLSLAKSDSGEMKLTITEFSLSDMLQDLYLSGRTLGETKDIQVHLHLQVEQEITIRGDQLLIHRMLLNLLSNGIKYTLSGGHVDISLRLDNGHAVIAFRDSGIGIDPRHLPHIFERFYRVDESRNRAIGGTGLGLAIVKAIAEAHRGRIDVVSTREVGSTFTVTLPLAGPPPAKSSRD